MSYERLKAALADRYLLERELGQGGMATVYLAEDLKHRRKVAVKVLRPDLAATMGAERFEREIEVAARLTHPHILGLIDSGDADGFFYYVMPFVDGETLRDRLARSGEFPVHEAVRLVAEIAEALSVAHRAGVVHRDIKPENILLSGRHAMVMDFGVAKAVTEASGRQQLTTAGVALGTPSYMAPEQATADEHVDGRVDIYALGVVMYEMLTGLPPFHGLSPQQTLAAHVMQAPAPVSQRRSGLSPVLEGVVMRCLAKRPADRFQLADELVAVLEPLATPSGGMTPTYTQPVSAVMSAATGGRFLGRSAAIGGAVLLVAGLGGWALWGRAPAIAALVEPQQLTRSAGVQGTPYITGDGKGVAYQIRGPGDTATRIELRRGTEGSAVPLLEVAVPLGWSTDGDKLLAATPRGLETVPALGGASTLVVAGAYHGAWSPDGGRLAYIRGDSLLLRVGDRPDTLLARTDDPHSMAWSPDGKWIAYVSGNSQYLTSWNIASSSLWIVPAGGGAPIQLTDGDAMDLSPTWAPDGRRLLFISGRAGTRDIYQLALDAQGRPRGAPVRVTVGLNASQISLSADGRQLAYSVTTNPSNIWRVRVPATGSVSSQAAELVTTDQESIESFAISRDGRWLVFDSDRSGVQQIFRRPLAGGEVQQVTRGESPAFYPTVSPDGKEIAYHAIVGGHRRIFTVPSEGGAQPIQVSPGSALEEMQPSWSPDGTRLAWQIFTEGGGRSVEQGVRSAAGWGAAREVASPRHVVFHVWGDTAQLLAVDTAQHRLELFDADNGTRPTRVLVPDALTRVARGVILVVSPDYRTVYFLNAEGLWLLPLRDGTPTGRPLRQVVRFDDPLHPHNGLYRSVSEHGGYVYFTLQQPRSNIWVAQVTGLER